MRGELIKIFTGSDDDSISMTITQLKQRYEETNNPIYPMFAFRYCFEREESPPLWALQYVALSFHEYLNNYGTKGIDECLQIKVKQGGTTPIKQFLLDERDDMIMSEMFKLVEYLKISLEVASCMVKAKLEHADWNKTLVELCELSENSIKDMYRKTPRKTLKDIKANAQVTETHFTEQKQKDFLNTFPFHTIPLLLAEKYGLKP